MKLRLASATLLATLAACGRLHMGELPTEDVDAGAPGTPDAPPPVRIGTDVMTDTGPVRGYAAGSLLVFKGIPYAAPPLGALRFAPTAPAIPWTATRLAVDDPAKCPQTLFQQLVGDEDCLTVNVWTQPTATAQPVMVFVHGGSGLAGGHYDAAALALRTGHVIVTVQYRLGALGHLVLPELTDANFALLDQQAALRWVQRNAAAFGGDPARVMLFGESEGSMYTCVHTMAPGSQGLFHAALAESGTCTQIPARADKLAEWQAMAQAAGCTDSSPLACLRTKTPGELVAATTAPAMTIVVDGTVVPERPSDAWRRGVGLGVPLVVGTNVDEANLFIQAYLGGTGLLPVIDARWGYETAIRLVWPAHADALLALYPYTTYGSGLAALDVMGTDLAFACPAREWARAWTLAGGTGWQYEFTPTLRGSLQSLGATHGLELAYVFDAWSVIPNYTPDADEIALSAWIEDAWGAFAATGNPGPDWPPYSWPDEHHYEIGFAKGARASFRDGRCDQLVQLGMIERLTTP